jgi:hypothetical protein
MRVSSEAKLIDGIAPLAYRRIRLVPADADQLGELRNGIRRSLYGTGFFHHLYGGRFLANKRNYCCHGFLPMLRNQIIQPRPT